jgi:hypothetical protein
MLPGVYLPCRPGSSGHREERSRDEKRSISTQKITRVVRSSGHNPQRQRQQLAKCAECDEERAQVYAPYSLVQRTKETEERPPYSPPNVQMLNHHSRGMECDPVRSICRGKRMLYHMSDGKLVECTIEHIGSLAESDGEPTGITISFTDQNGQIHERNTLANRLMELYSGWDAR